MSDSREPPQDQDQDLDPSALAERLEWCEGDASPTGRRVLDIRPASRTLLSASADAEAARHVLEAPADIEALASGWPDDARSTAVDWSFDDTELKRMQDGFAPAAMEDKWRIVSRLEGAKLHVFFRRSWTNDLVFVLELEGGQAKALRYPKGAYRPELSARAILDGYVFGRTCVIPAPRVVGEDKRRLMSYGISVAGRRCGFVEPEDARTWFVRLGDPGVVHEHADGNALDRQLPREAMDEGMEARFRFGLHSLLYATVAMLLPSPAHAVENGTLPTADAGLDHRDLSVLRRWLDGIANMDEAALRRAAVGLGAEPFPDNTKTEDVPRLLFGKVPSSRWLVWGRGRPKDGRLRALVARPVLDHVLAEVTAEDPRFALGKEGWALAWTGTGEDLLAMVRGDAVVRGFSCTGARHDSRDDATEAAPATTVYPSGPRAWSWQLARTGVPVPAKRCYWVIESLLLAGAYPESPNPEEHGRRVEDLWRAGIRTFVSLVEEKERSPSGAELAKYTDAVATLSARWGEQATCVRLPIRDLSAPSPDAMRTILDVIDLSLEGTRPVYVHCLGGVGRTGTVIGCWLRRHRISSPEEVLAVIARLRRADVERADRPSPETAAQRAMVVGWMHEQPPRA